MSVREILNVTKSVIRSKGGVCDSGYLFDRMQRMGVSDKQLRRAIRKDMSIELLENEARLVEK